MRSLGLTSVPTSSLIGVAIACSGNILISLALTVQKLAHRRQEEELEASSGRSSVSDGSETVPADDQDDVRDRGRPHLTSPTPPPGPQVLPVLLVPTEEASSAKREENLVDLGDPDHPSDDGTALQLNLGPAGEGSKRNLSVLSRSSDSDGTPRRPARKWRSRSPSPIRLPVAVKSDTSHTALVPDPTAQDKGRSAVENGRPGHSHRSANKQGDDDDGETHEGKHEVEEGMYLKSRLWWLGMVLIAVGEGGNFLSYGFAPASVVAPLGTVALIANCVFAPLILRERFHAKELIGMGLAILGAVTVVYSSNPSNPRIDPPALLNAIRQIPFIVYTSLNLAAMSLLITLSRSPRYGGRFIVIDIGVCALFGGYTVLSTKALSSLLSTMFLNAFGWWITWILLLVLIVTSILQVKFLNRALMRFQSKEVIPTQFVFFSMAAIIGSAVLYQEFRDIPFSRFVNFAFGIGTTFLGVHLLTSFSEPDETSDSDSISTSHQTPRNIPPPLPRNHSLNLLLPTTSRLSSHSGPIRTPSERTPLLLPIASPEALRRPSDASMSSTSRRDPSTSVPVGPGSLPRVRLVKKNSNGDFAPTLGLGSQAGFLLMATTPPATSGSFGRRDSSMQRSMSQRMDQNVQREDRQRKVTAGP